MLPLPSRLDPADPSSRLLEERSSVEGVAEGEGFPLDSEAPGEGDGAGLLASFVKELVVAACF